MNTQLRWLWWLLGIVVVGIIIISIWPSAAPTPQSQMQDQTAVQQQTSGVSNPPTTTGAPAPAPRQSAAGGNSITVAGHQQPGKSIIVASVRLVSPGYVTVNSASSNYTTESAGALLAYSKLLPAGTSTNVSIAVATSPAGHYFVQLRKDNGNKIFSLAEDPLALDANGNPISALVIADAPISTSFKTVYVSMQNLAFSPASLTVTKGDQVTFLNKDAVSHTVTAAAFGGQHVINGGGLYTLDTSTLARGTYSYHCDFHSGMTGTLIVQ